MRKINVIIAALGLCAFAGAASATITGVSFSGPGGTGSDGLTGGNLTEPRLDYTSINFIDVTINFDSAGTYTVNEAPGFGDIANHTGQTWTSFDLQIRPGSVGTFNADWSGNAFSTITQSGTDIFFSNGTVANNGHFDPFGTFTAQGAGTIVIRETPGIVPEPGAAVLPGLGGLFAIGALRRKRLTTPV
jgi:hypothetical protein